MHDNMNRNNMNQKWGKMKKLTSSAINMVKDNITSKIGGLHNKAFVILRLKVLPTTNSTSTIKMKTRNINSKSSNSNGFAATAAVAFAFASKPSYMEFLNDCKAAINRNYDKQGCYIFNANEAHLGLTTIVQEKNIGVTLIRKLAVLIMYLLFFVSTYFTTEYKLQYLLLFLLPFANVVKETQVVSI